MNSPLSKPFTKFSLSFKEKLQGLKLSLKVWRKQVSASKNSHASAIYSSLLDFNTKAEAGTLTPFDIDQRSKHIKELHDLEYKNIKDLCQKAKSKWALDGDDNSSCNSSFITLVPKCDDPLVLNDYMPISLIGCQYKIIAMILANRLGKVIASVSKMYKRKLFLLKVDFEKAFDTLSWSFLESVMCQTGFNLKWKGWILACLRSGYTSVLINGSPTREFKLERGLRQGDPLYPLLLILAVEALNASLLDARKKNLFRGVEVGIDKIHISHLQYADDALIMGEWSLSNAKNLSTILSCFHLASGLKVNFNKSIFHGVGVSHLELNYLALAIGCQPCNFPCIYLGLSIGLNLSRCSNWFLLIDRFQKRLSNWKAKTLSIGGRLTLSKAILVIMEYLVNISKKSAFWSLNEDILKITMTALTKDHEGHKTNTPYPRKAIRRIQAI
ncbi:putative RNA-directed DNA polymerase, eukaryota, reverse transcriptase zinc-binding domain protein [Tanacetum coccineum]